MSVDLLELFRLLEYSEQESEYVRLAGHLDTVMEGMELLSTLSKLVLLLVLIWSGRGDLGLITLNGFPDLSGGIFLIVEIYRG